MVKKISIITSIFLFNLNFLSAQNQNELPDLSEEDRWARASWLMDVSNIAAINYAKSNGDNVKDYGNYLGKLYAPGWSAKTPWGMVRGMVRNNQTFPGFKVEILDQKENMVKFRMNRPYKARFGDDKEVYGVTIKEYEKLWSVFHNHLANHLGFNYNEKIKDDWRVITIRKK